MLSTMYQVTITNSFSNANTAAGFIDSKRTETYMAEGSTPATLAASINKERGNIRYRNVVEQLQTMANIYVTNTVANAATANSAATSFVMTLEVERGDDYLLTRDETANNAVELSGAAAIKRCVARGLMVERLAERTEVVDPTASAGHRDGATANAIARVGSRIMDVDVGKLTNNLTTAETAITVTKL